MSGVMALTRHLAPAERRELVSLCRAIVAPGVPPTDSLDALCRLGWAWLDMGDVRGTLIAGALGLAFAEVRDIVVNAAVAQETGVEPTVWSAPSALLSGTDWRDADARARRAFRARQEVYTYDEVAQRQREAQAARLAAVKARRVDVVPDQAAAEREVKRRLREDPDARESLGLAIGGKRKGDRIVRVVCPACGRPSVWWYLDPSGHDTRSAMCEHKGSCGWGGGLYDLAAGVNIGPAVDARQVRL